jgi:hypothetical protein
VARRGGGEGTVTIDVGGEMVTRNDVSLSIHFF